MSGIFYLVVFLIVFLINLAIPRIRNNWMRRLVLFISFSILISLIGFRYQVGTDYDSYMNVYQSIKSNDFEFAVTQKLEPFVGAIYWLLSKIFTMDYWIYFMYGIMTIAPIYLINRKYKYKYLGYSVLLYCLLFLPFSLNGMRQSAAMSIVLLSAFYLVDQKKVQSIITFVLAFLVHRSALLVLPQLIAYFVCNKKKWRFDKVNIILSVAISIFILFFLGDFVASNMLDSKDYYEYILSDISADRIFISTNTIHYLPLAIFAFVSKTKKTEKDMILPRNMIYTGIIYSIISSSAQYLSRITLYFLPFSIMVLPAQYYDIKPNENGRIMMIITAIYAITIFIIQIIVNGWHDIVPYQTWIGM